MLRSRRCVVEVVAAFGLPLPTLGAVAVVALAGPLDLGRGPLEGGADLVGLDLGDRPLVALGGLPAALAVRAWEAEILAFHSTEGCSNGPSEAVNLLIKKLKRVGHGFRNWLFVMKRRSYRGQVGGVRNSWRRGWSAAKTSRAM